MAKKRSIAKLSLAMTGAFEAELLLTLMLREWKHPLADDREFAQNLLESAAEILQASVRGEQLVEEHSPEHMNLIAAIYLAESNNVSADVSIEVIERQNRAEWLTAIRRSLPSCFCDPDLLL